MALHQTVSSPLPVLLRRLCLLLTAAVFVLFFPLELVAQVNISLPTPQYTVGDQIRAKVENTGSRAITICIDIGRTSMNRGRQESTPSPFEVEKEERGKWGMLLAPDDIGFYQIPQVVASGESLEFPVRFSDTGTFRFRLQYWRGALPKLDCKKPPKRAKIATSPPFVEIDDRGSDRNGPAHGKSRQ